MMPNTDTPDKPGVEEEPIGAVLSATPGPPLPDTFQAGMLLDSVNGESVEEMSFTAVTKLIAETGRPLTLVFRTVVRDKIHGMLNAKVWPTEEYTWKEEGKLGLQLVPNVADIHDRYAEDVPNGAVPPPPPPPPKMAVDA